MPIYVINMRLKLSLSSKESGMVLHSLNPDNNILITWPPLLTFDHYTKESDNDHKVLSHSYVHLWLSPCSLQALVLDFFFPALSRRLS